MENNKTVTIQGEEKVGQVQIADEVVAIIAGLAAIEVEGVAGMAGNFTGDLVEILGKKNLSKGVTVDVGEQDVSVDLGIVIQFGVKIPEVAEIVQQKVKNSIETMTGLSVTEVNLHITGIHFEKSKINKTEMAEEM
ncbi:MAG: Asp23/Gls24 family envelope stress response protein [Epulopiscium sp.]|nr:Asp23/Gls24 family envelope stress response protein [Candidatus Epulonipiscium sp.]